MMCREALEPLVKALKPIQAAYLYCHPHAGCVGDGLAMCSHIDCSFVIGLEVAPKKSLVGLTRVSEAFTFHDIDYMFKKSNELFFSKR